MNSVEPLNTDPPLGVTLHHYDGDTAEVSFRSNFRTSWMRALIAFLAIGWLFGLIGFFVSIGQGNLTAAGILLAFSLGGGIFVFKFGSVTVDIMITPETIEIHGVEYDRRFWSGFVLIGKTTLGFYYRGKAVDTGFELPSAAISYNKSVSPAEVVIWLNDLADDTGVIHKPSPEAGIRQQKF